MTINSELEVMETPGAFACSALSRPHASRASGVVSADIQSTYQGTGLPFASRIVVDGQPTARVRKGDLSGNTTWSPPV
jgi:hypothetical protein